MNKSLLLSLLFLLPTFMWGEVNGKSLDIYEKVTTIKGDTYEGYIVRQNVGESISFHSLISTITDSAYAGGAMSSTFVPENQIEDNWKWLLEKGQIELHIEGGKKGLLLRSFETKNNVASNVYVLQKGENFVHYIDVKKGDITVKFSDIKQIEYLHEQNEASQLVDVVKFYAKRPEVKGYIVKQIIGQSLYVKDVASSMVTKVELSDVESIGKCKNTPSMSWAEQSRWIEIVELKNGTIIEGFVTQKTYGEKNGDAFMVITTLDDSYEVVKMEQVISIRRKLNSDYISIPSADFANTCALFNGVQVKEVELKESARYSLNRGEIVIKNARNLFTDIRVKTRQGEDASILMQRNKKGTSHDVVAYKVTLTIEDEVVCSYKDILNNSKCSVNETSDEVILNRFKLPHGMYMFYVKRTNKVYLVNIKR